MSHQFEIKQHDGGYSLFLNDFFIFFFVTKRAAMRVQESLYRALHAPPAKAAIEKQIPPARP